MHFATPPVMDPGERPGGPPSPLFLDQTEARKAEKKYLGEIAFHPHLTYLRVWMTAPPPPSPPLPSPSLSQGLDPALPTTDFPATSEERAEKFPRLMTSY